MPQYSFIIVKVGLVIISAMPKPFAKPFVKVVLPAPKSPFKTITQLLFKLFAKFSAKVCVSSALLDKNSSMPVPEKNPVRDGFTFKGWSTSLSATDIVSSSDTVTENTTLYAMWEELPLCKDGTYNHKWTNEWAPSIDGVSEVCGCKNCDAVLTREIEKAEDAE